MLSSRRNRSHVVGKKLYQKSVAEEPQTRCRILPNFCMSRANEKKHNQVIHPVTNQTCPISVVDCNKNVSYCLDRCSDSIILRGWNGVVCEVGDGKIFIDGIELRNEYIRSTGHIFPVPTSDSPSDYEVWFSQLNAYDGATCSTEMKERIRNAAHHFGNVLNDKISSATFGDTWYSYASINDSPTGRYVGCVDGPSGPICQCIETENGYLCDCIEDSVCKQILNFLDRDFVDEYVDNLC